MNRPFAVASLLVLATACFETDPCDRYVDYVCTCHADDPGFDCETLSRTLADADPDVQDQCAIDLAVLEQEDADEGRDCQVDTGL